MCGRGTHLPVSYQFPFFPAQHPRPLLSPAPTPPAFSHPPSSLLHRQHPHASSEWSPAWRSLVSLATNGRISWWRRKWKAAKVSSRDGANSVPSPSFESLDAPPPTGWWPWQKTFDLLYGTHIDSNLQILHLLFSLQLACYRS
jgi:hypothetical protein